MTRTRRQRASDDRRERVIRAALELVPSLGLHNTPMSAIAERAGVAKGTPYVYFESKEALINAVYAELTADRERVMAESVGSDLAPREQLWRTWSSAAAWHLERRDAWNFMQQCEASGILTEATRAAEAEREVARMAGLRQAVRRGLMRDLPSAVVAAHFLGPILVLAQAREKGELAVDEDLLRLTFDGVARALCDLAGDGPRRTAG